MNIQKASNTILVCKLFKVWKDLYNAGRISLFYDSFRQRIILVKNKEIYVWDQYDPTNDTNPLFFKLSSSEEIIDLVLSPDDKYILLHTVVSSLIFIEFDNKNQELSIIKFDQINEKIFGISFCITSLPNFFVFLSSGIRIYSPANKLKQILIPFLNNGYLFDPFENIVAFCTENKPNELKLYALKDIQKGKYVQSPSISLGLTSKNTIPISSERLFFGAKSKNIFMRKSMLNSDGPILTMIKKLKII